MNINDLYMLAGKYYEKKDFSNALSCLQEVNRVQPGNTKVLLNMAACFEQLQDHENCINVIKQLIKTDKNNHGLHHHLGHLYFRLGDIEKSIEAFEQALQLNPNVANYYYYLADIYERTNQNDKALQVLAQGLRHFPNDVSLEVLTARCERRLGNIEESHNRLENLSARESDMPPKRRIDYHFEMGFIYDRKNDADLAFRYFTRANELVRATPEYQSIDSNESLNRIHTLSHLDYGKINKIIELSKKNPPPLQPIFFVGFPRSGTTLLEMVLDSHSQIEVIGEKNTLAPVISMIEKEPEKYLDSPFLMDKENIENLRNIYFNEASKYVSVDGSSVVVDKMPMNIVQVHIIKILFPDARVLLGLRHPCDAILSCFMQNFALSPGMVQMFEFKSIIDYYDKIMRLWEIFKNEIGFDNHFVRYEDLIENMEEETRKLLLFLDLPWNEEVLNYRENAFNRGFIRTPSYSQVVKPVYKEARYRWHRYAKYFEPYFDVLKPHCDAFNYSLQFDGYLGQ